jgi:hypothetical protein
MYSSVYGNAGAIPVVDKQVIVGIGPVDYPRRKRSDVDREVVMTIRRPNATVTVAGYGGMPVQIPAPDETVQVQVPRRLPTCALCTTQHRGECF